VRRRVFKPPVSATARQVGRLNGPAAIDDRTALTAMRISLNLSPAESPRDSLALGWATPTALLGLAALVLLCRASLGEYRQLREFQIQLLAAQARTADLHRREEAMRRKLEDPLNREVIRRLRFVNDIIARRRLSPAELNAQIVGLLPRDARLTGLALASPRQPDAGYVVRIGIAARSEDSVQAFVNALEDAPDFKDVSITNQGFQEAIAQPEPVNIVCTAQYLAKVRRNEEKPSAEATTAENQSNR